MALVIALMLLAMLSLLGSAALLTSNVEMKISGNTRTGRTAFFAADGAGQVASGVVADCITDVGWYPDNYAYGPGVLVVDGDFAFEPKYMDDDGDPLTDDRTTVPDIVFDAPLKAYADVDQGSTTPVAGASAVGSAGYEGAGKGAAGGGMKTVYHIQVRGELGNRAMALLFMTYDHYL